MLVTRATTNEKNQSRDSFVNVTNLLSRTTLLS
nr:MAG TPA: hypothetical protein [Caudoviricetes sp.]